MKVREQDLEKLKLFINQFAKYYRMSTGKTLTSIEELMELIESGEYTLEDIFYEKINEINFSEEESIHWEDNMEKFSYENFFPHSKEVDGNSIWIKIRTDSGYEVHLAKRSLRKHRWNEIAANKRLELELCVTRLKKALGRKYKTIKDLDSLARKQPKFEKLRDDYLTACIYFKIGVPLHEVFIRRTKSKKEYYLPHEYEVIEDVNEYIDYYLKKVPGVKFYPIIIGENDDKIFYMQSRGIPKEVAIVMCNLRNTYIKIDLDLMNSIYFSSRIEFSASS